MALDITRIQALCFDVDGTLRDTDDQYVARFLPWIRPFRWLLPGQDAQRAARRLVMWLEGPGNFFFGIPDRFGWDDELAGLGKKLSFFSQNHKPHNYLLVPGVDECLQFLSQQYPLAVVTARGETGTLTFLEHYHIGQYFKKIASAQTAPRTKPYPDPILWVAKQLGISASSCLMIGDTVVDIKAGRAAGAQTVGVLSGFGEETELRNSGADLILPSVADLPSILHESASG